VASRDLGHDVPVERHGQALRQNEAVDLIPGEIEEYDHRSEREGSNLLEAVGVVGNPTINPDPDRLSIGASSHTGTGSASNVRRHSLCRVYATTVPVRAWHWQYS